MKFRADARALGQGSDTKRGWLEVGAWWSGEKKGESAYIRRVRKRARDEGKKKEDYDYDDDVGI